MSNITDFVIKDGILKKYNGKGGDVVIPEGVKAIDMSAFSKQQTITSVTIPNEVISIGFSAFYNCTGIKKISLPNSLTKIGVAAFSGCTALT